MKNQRLALLLALATVALWSTVASAFKISLRFFAPEQLLLVAATTSTLVLWMLVALQGKTALVRQALCRRPAFYGLNALLNPTAYYLLLFAAYARLPGQQAQAITYTWAIALSLLAVPFLGQRLRWPDGVAMVLAYGGALVIATQGDVLHLRLGEPLGVVLALASTLLWAGSWILNTRNDADAVVSLTATFSLSLPLIGAATALFADFHLSAWQGWVGAMYIGLFEMGFAFVLWLTALKYATHTASLANLMYIAPFVSLLLLHRIAGESIGGATPAGLALIVFGLLIQQHASRRTAGGA